MPRNVEQDSRKFILREYLLDVEQKGAAYIPNFLKLEAVQNLKGVCGRLEFEKQEKQYESGVSESYFVPKDIPQNIDERIVSLGEEIRQRLFGYSLSFPALVNWQPTEYSIQKYDKDSFITSHRDKTSIKGLVAVVSISGEADFEVKEERKGEPFAKWRIKEGDLVILRASEFNRNIEGHPGVFHAVSGGLTEEPRISIGFRQR